MNGSPHAYLIIGCGRFGSWAAERLYQKDSDSNIIVVDKNKKALQKVSRLPIDTAVSNGIT
jgi:saccharopine dehydrogenase-like NADP-dependent oxidoreductase